MKYRAQGACGMLGLYPGPILTNILMYTSTIYTEAYLSAESNAHCMLNHMATLSDSSEADKQECRN